MAPVFNPPRAEAQEPAVHVQARSFSLVDQDGALRGALAFWEDGSIGFVAYTSSGDPHAFIGVNADGSLSPPRLPGPPGPTGSTGLAGPTGPPGTGVAPSSLRASSALTECIHGIDNQLEAIMKSIQGLAFGHAPYSISYFSRCGGIISGASPVR